MRGILLKRFFRCRALTSAPNSWPPKRRKSFPLLQVKRQKLTTAPIFSQQAIAEDDDSSEEEDTLDEDMQSEQGVGKLTTAPIFSQQAIAEDDDSSEEEDILDEDVQSEQGVGKLTTAPIFSQQAIAEDDDSSEEEEDILDEDVQIEQSVGASECLPEELSEIFVKPINVLDVPSAAKEKSSLYPSVVYEGSVATVKLGVGQMVILDGCAMVQVVEGQASMLGYSFLRGADVLVCSSSKLAEVITIEARHVSGDERSGGIELMDVNMVEGREDTKSLDDVLACQLRFASHSLGQNIFTSSVVPGRALSFKLEFIGSLGSSLGKKRKGEILGNQDQDDINELDSEDDELDLNSEASYSDSEDGDEKDDQIEVPVEDVELAAVPKIAKKRKGRGLDTSSAKKRRVVETFDDYSSATTLPCDWKEAVESITLGSNEPVIVICGAKNVGKSTFARFLVNSLLNRYNEVAYLDTDVGQPEFTAPGCISLHILNSPVVGPPAMHLRSPERCFFYGDVSPKSNPLMYSEHVADLFNYFRQKYSVNSTSTIPLVINTHGWVKGIGYDVVVDILNATSPTHVVQVLALLATKNLPRNKFWDEMSTAESIYVESAVEKLPMHHRSSRSAHHLRAARLLAYFQQCFGENSAPFPYRESKLFAQTAISLVRDTPYEVPFTALKIKHLHSEVPPSESLRCVNATIVGLGVTSVDKDTLGKDDLRKSTLPLCLGLGIVKAVDVKRGMFYISTPVPQEQLRHVDILLQGRVEIPVPLLMARGYMSPYLSKSSQIVEGVGARAMKSTMKPSTK